MFYFLFNTYMLYHILQQAHTFVFLRSFYIVESILYSIILHCRYCIRVRYYHITYVYVLFIYMLKGIILHLRYCIRTILHHKIGLLLNTCTIYKTKYELPSYIGSLPTVWGSDAQELPMQAICLMVISKHQNDTLLLMSRYMAVFHILF